ncbi:hypothetical protein FACS189490_12930 [Clostridia bacterium]|nr:hypothetical protein FACS189490_12930 [Clostridia bacterium]
MFEAIKKFFSKIFQRGKTRKIALHSRFGHMLENLDPSTDEYKAAVEAVALCDESVSVVSQRLMALTRIKDFDEQLAELECFNKMTEEDTENLKILLDRFVSLSRDKNNLKYQITDFDKSLVKMEEFEEEAHSAVENITDAEDKQRIFKQDVDTLRGEKEELEYEREVLAKSIDFVYKFTIGLVVFFGFIAMGLVAMFLIKDIDIFVPVAGISVVVIITIPMLYVLRRRLRYDMLMNVKKQKRAVELINRKNVVYAHYTNFLTYSYNKYKVRNSDMLKANIRDFTYYKNLTKRFDALRSLMFQTENDITRLLREYGIGNMSMTLENFAKTFSIDDKRNFYNETIKRKNEVENALVKLDARQEQIWDSLIFLEQGDYSDTSVIHEIIQMYMGHVSNMITNPRVLTKEELENEPEPEDEDEKVLVPKRKKALSRKEQTV